MTIDTEHLENMRVCGPCGCAVGTFQFGPNRQWLVQSGRCPRHLATDTDECWDGWDFNKLVEMCLCCGAVALRSGHRFAVWFCEPCKAEILLLNARLGRYAVPIGRHSVHAGVLLRLADVENPVRVETFLDRIHSSSEAMDVLGEWGIMAVRMNLASLGVARESSMSLPEYCRRAADLVDPAARFRQMCAYLDRRGRELRETGKGLR